MSASTPAFHTDDGWLTLYGLACGYIEVDETNNVRTTLWMGHGCLHVRQHDHTKKQRIFWDVFDDDLDAARERFAVATNRPVHQHDCPNCTFIGCYRLRHPYTDDGALEGDPVYAGTRTGVPGKVVTMGDVYLACGGSSYRYIVRYGIQGEYATTNVPARYVLAPLVDGDDDSDPRPLLEQLQEANANAPDWRDVAIPFDIVDGIET